MKKLITIFIILLCIVSTSPIYAEEETKTNNVNATTEIIYNHETGLLEVTNIIIPCNGAYYGIVVNDGVNYSNKNNYFTTASGLTIMITNEELKAGINKENGITSIQELENGVFLVVKGNDEENVLNVYNGVFKATESAFQMFYHDIAKEWTDEVIITNDVVSFSNGEDIIYVYQNPGSISDWSYKGQIEPTVFYKELRGIDIPITYPEDQNDSNYIPYYHDRVYEPYKTNGFVPYSTYDAVAGYIILAKDHETLKSLFNTYNDRIQEIGSIKINKRNIDSFDIDVTKESISEIKEYAKEVINSDNRYHLTVSTDDIDEAIANNLLYPIESYGLVNSRKKMNETKMGDAVSSTSFNLNCIYVRPSIRTINHGRHNSSDITIKDIYTGFIEPLTDHGSFGLNMYSEKFLNIYENGIGFDNKNKYTESTLIGDYLYFRTLNNLIIYKSYSKNVTPLNGHPLYEKISKNGLKENGYRIYNLEADKNSFITIDTMIIRPIFVVNKYLSKYKSILDVEKILRLESYTQNLFYTSAYSCSINTGSNSYNVNFILTSLIKYPS